MGFPIHVDRFSIDDNAISKIMGQIKTHQDAIRLASFSRRSNRFSLNLGSEISDHRQSMRFYCEFSS